MKKAKILAFLLFISSIILVSITRISYAFLIEIAYIVLNLLYSKWLKRIEILDVFCLALFYVIRIAFGGALTSIVISDYLYLTVLSLALYLGFSKRRNEYLTEGTQKRAVLSKYTIGFLDKTMNAFLILTIVFYSSWCENMRNYYGQRLTITIPVVLLIMLKYNLDVDYNDNDDPVDIVLNDRKLIGLILFYGIIMLYIFYIK